MFCPITKMYAGSLEPEWDSLFSFLVQSLYPMTYHHIVPSAKERKENLPPIIRNKNIIYRSISQSRLWDGSKMRCSRWRQQSFTLNDVKWWPHPLTVPFMTWYLALKFPIYSCAWRCAYLRLSVQEDFAFYLHKIQEN